MTPRYVRYRLATDQVWLERGILAIDRGQTADEFCARQTRYLNRRGWNAADAALGGYLASYIRTSSRPMGQRLTGGWVVKARALMRKYARQLCRIAAERVAA